MHRTTILLVVLLLLTPPVLADWPSYGHDAANTRTADETGAIQAVHARWTHTAGGHVLSSPAVTDVAGQTRIVAASYPGTSGTGSVFALDAQGNQVWSVTPAPLTNGGFLSSPAVVDTDGDGSQEVLVAKLESSTLHLLDAATGSQEASHRFGQDNRDLLAASPAVAELDPTSPGLEVVLGGSRTNEAGSLLVLSGDLSSVLFSALLNAPAWASPLVADTDGDGVEELVVATGVPDTACLVFGTLHPTNTPKRGDDQGRLYLFERQGDAWALRWESPLAGPTIASPTLGDLDGDGTPEVVVGAQGPRGSCEDPNNVQGAGYLHAFDAANGTELARSADVSSLAGTSSPATADLDGDGTVEVVQGTWNGIRTYTLSASQLVQEAAFELPATPQGADEWVAASPALADIDGDGDLDVVGLTMPVNVDLNAPTESEALPGLVFALDGPSLTERWSYRLSEDGGLSGPVVADLDGDRLAEVLVGTGFPTIGQAREVVALSPKNPVVRDLAWTPETPTPLDAVQFELDVVDEDHEPAALTYAWDLGDGTNTTGRTVTHTFPDDGTYDVTVAVTDPDGHTWTERRTVTVTNVAPRVELDVSTNPGSLEVGVTASVSDPDGTVVTHGLDLGDGTNTTALDLTHTYPTGGSYAATLTATDDDGDVSETTQLVHVNRAPSLTGPDHVTGREGSPVTVVLNATDLDGDALATAAVEGLPGATASLDGGQVVLTWVPPYDAAGSWQATVRAGDDGRPALEAMHPVALSIWDTDRPPVVGAPDERTVKAGRTATFTGALGDPDGDPVTLTPLALPPGATLEADSRAWRLTFPTTVDMGGEQHALHLEASDGNLTATLETTVEVLPNEPPVAILDAPATAQASTPWAPAPVTLDGNASRDPDGDGIVRWLWTVDGEVLEGPVVEHAFTTHGTHTVGLEVTDAAGATGASQATVLVDDALTGVLEVVREGTGPNDPAVLLVHLFRDDGTPLGDQRGRLRLVHETLGRETANETFWTNGDGVATLALTGDLGLPFFLPGDHAIEVTAQAASVTGAVEDDREHLTMTAPLPVSVG